ncbi:MAG: MFS transporter [Asticcacaulis sp.]
MTFPPPLPLDVPAAKTRWPLGLMATLSLAMALSTLSTSIASVALPTLARSFEASFSAVQWIVLAFLLAVTTLIVSVGRLGDLIGPRRLMLWGIGLFTLASGVCGLSPDLSVLIGARVFQGLGAAVLMALSLAFVSAAVPKSHSGRAMGLIGTMSAIGTALGPSLGGFLLVQFDWSALFLINLPIGGLLLVLAWLYLPADPKNGSTSPRARFDVPGTILLALSTGSYALALTVNPATAADPTATGLSRFIAPQSLMLLGVATASALGFIVLQSRSSSPLIPLDRLKAPRLRNGLILAVMVMSVMMATLVVGPFWLSFGLHLPAPQVGLAMSTGPIVSALTGIPAGRLIDRFGPFLIMRSGLAVCACGCLALGLLPLTSGMAGYMAVIATVTCGYALFQAANTTAVMANVEATERGAISGALNLARNLGLITGAALLGTAFARATGAADATRAEPLAIAAGFHTTFLLAAGIILMALVVALFTPALPSKAVEGAPS